MLWAASVAFVRNLRGEVHRQLGVLDSHDRRLGVLHGAGRERLGRAVGALLGLLQRGDRFGQRAAKAPGFRAARGWRFACGQARARGLRGLCFGELADGRGAAEPADRSKRG